MASNGSGNGSGVVAAAPTLPTGIAGVSVHRSQLVRLMLQQLADLGYDKAATALKEESGDHLEDDALLEFRASVLEGRWESAIGMVHELEFKSEAARTAAHVTLFRQQYLELLEAGQSWAALKVLRTSITPLVGRARVPTHAHTSAGNGSSGHGPSNGASTGTPNSTSNGTSNGTTDVPPSNGASNDTSDCGGDRLGLGEGFGSLFASPHAATLGRRPRGDSNASDGAYSNLWSTSDSEDSDDGDDTDGALSLGAPSSPGDGAGEDDVTIVPSVATLAALALCQSPAQLRAHASWPGVHGGSRRDVLEAVQALLAPDVAVPPRRLLHLVGQAVAYQTQACLHHNTRSTLVSLMKDHRCSADVVPTRQACVLSDHGGEVWMVRFNRAGTRFATVGGDGAILIWAVPDALVFGGERSCPVHAPTSPSAAGGGASDVPRVIHRLTGHTRGVSSIDWSPDGSMLLSASGNRVWVWDMNTGAFVRHFTHRRQPVLAVAWLPDGVRFVCGGADKSISMWHVEDGCECRWKVDQVTDLKVSQTGNHVVALCRERRLATLNLDSGTCWYADDGQKATAMALSRDGRYAVLSLKGGCSSLWDLALGKQLHMYYGTTQQRYVVRSCFGGRDEAFVASGSEDCRVYVHHRHRATLLATLEGHAAVVNDVSWSPTNCGLLVSCSDDGTVRLWTAPATSPMPGHPTATAAGLCTCDGEATAAAAAEAPAAGSGVGAGAGGGAGEDHADGSRRTEGEDGASAAAKVLLRREAREAQARRAVHD